MLEGHLNGVMAVAFSHGGIRIVSGSDGCSVWIWECDFREERMCAGGTFRFGYISYILT